MTIIIEAIAMVEPMMVSFVAWIPSPFSRNLCPGRTPRNESSSGAPKKIDGMKFRKVCVIAVLVRKMRRVVVGSFRKKGMEIIIVAMRLVWIPGVRPLMVPERMPRSRGRIRLSILF